MKRLLCLVLCLLLAAAPALGEELDEETLALMEEETRTPAAVTHAPDEIFAASDVAGDDTWEARIDAGPLPAFVQLLLEVAAGEIGYTEGVNNRSKYGEWSGDPNAAWCAEFICWCINRVDELYGAKLLNEVYPNYSGQNTGRDWFIKRGRFLYRKGTCPGWGSQWLRESDHELEKNEYIPRPGDLVFFSYNEAGDTEHVALVEYCAYDSMGDVIIHVIEGNNPSSVQRNRYRLSNSQVLGFGLCEDVMDTTIRYGCRGDKVLQLQKGLHRLGLLAERHLTGTCGSNTKKAIMNFQSTCMKGKEPTGVADRETQQALQAMLDELVDDSPDTWLVTE